MILLSSITEYNKQILIPINLILILFLVLTAPLSFCQEEHVDQQIKTILQNDKSYSRGYDLFLLAESYERREEWRKAEKIYQAIVDNLYNKETDEPTTQMYGFLAEQRIQWIHSDKSWYFQDKEELIRKIKESLEQGDAEALINYACHGWFEISHDESDVIYIEDIKEVYQYFKENLKNSIVRVEEAILNEYSKDKEHKENHLWIRTVGWRPTKEYPFKEILLKINKDARGWQWDGMMFCYGAANWTIFLDWLEGQLSAKLPLYEEKKIYAYLEDYFVFNRDKSRTILELMLRTHETLKDPGRAYFLMGEIDTNGRKAQEMYEKVVTQYPESSAYSQAEQKLKYLIDNSREPQEALEWYLKGKQARRRKFFMESIAQFSRLVEKYPLGKWAGETQFFLARSYFSQSKFEEARVGFEKVFEKYRNSKDGQGNLLAPFALLFIANSYHHQHKYSEALTGYQKVINFFSYYVLKAENELVFSPAMQARYFMAMVYYLMRDYDKRIAVFQVLSKVKGNFYFILNHWAKLYCEDSPFSCVCSKSESLIAEALMGLAKLYSRRKENMEEALRLYSQLLMDKSLRKKIKYEDRRYDKSYFDLGLLELTKIEDQKYRETITRILNRLSKQFLTEREKLCLLKYWSLYLLGQKEYLAGLEKWAEHVHKSEDIGEEQIDIWVNDNDKMESIVLKIDKGSAGKLFKSFESLNNVIKSTEKKGYVAYLEAIYLENVLKQNGQALDKYEEAAKLLKDNGSFWIYKKLAEGKSKTLRKAI